MRYTLLGRDKTTIDNLVNDMMQAAFEPVVKAFPEISTGDFSPSAHFALHDALRSALTEWIIGNAPPFSDLPILVDGERAILSEVADENDDMEIHEALRRIESGSPKEVLNLGAHGIVTFEREGNQHG
jgi:hypothetical protein